VTYEESVVDGTVEGVDRRRNISALAKLSTFDASAEYFARSGPPGLDQTLVECLSQLFVMLAIRQKADIERPKRRIVERFDHRCDLMMQVARGGAGFRLARLSVRVLSTLP
jgi:hypothetical protein